MCANLADRHFPIFINDEIVGELGRFWAVVGQSNVEEVARIDLDGIDVVLSINLGYVRRAGRDSSTNLSPKSLVSVRRGDLKVFDGDKLSQPIREGYEDVPNSGSFAIDEPMRRSDSLELDPNDIVIGEKLQNAAPLQF
ncbi:hypothetical protein ASE94_15995 [Devosia sp. Leaf64]|nr:hypothetical protein ASE94_15995 [Devosia sp. Leaf64]